MNIEIEILWDVDDDQGGIVGYYAHGHVDQQDFISNLENIIDIEPGIYLPDYIFYEYAKWIPNPHYSGASDVLDISEKPKKDYFPITFYKK